MKCNLLLLALLCAATAASAEQVYKWTDSAGVVHYSDAPPPQNTQNVQTVHVSGGVHALPTEAAATTEPESKPEGAAANGNAPPPGVTADAAELRKKNCQQARANLELLQSNYPVAGTNGKALDDSSRRAQITDTNAQVTFYCR